jgi:hypothetical protein
MAVCDVVIVAPPITFFNISLLQKDRAAPIALSFTLFC